MTEKNEELEGLREAYQADPKNKDNAASLAQLYTDLGWLNEAIAIYKDIVVLYPNDFSILLAYGNICFTKQNTKEALNIFTKLTILKPKRVEGWNNLGIVQLSTEDFKAAKNSFNKVLELEPQNHGALLNMGNYYDHIGEIEKAIEMFKKAAAARPYFSDAWFNLGNAYLEKKQFENAIEVFEKSLKYNPNFSSALKNIGFAYEKIENYEKSEEYYLKTLDLNKADHALYINIATIYTKLERYDKAKEFFLGSVKLAPNNAAGWMGLRKLSLKKGDIKTYVKSTLAILHRLDSEEILDSLKVLRKLRQYESIERILTAADKLGTSTIELDAERMLVYARSDKNKDKAEIIYRRLSAKTAASAHSLHCFAEYCMKREDYDNAIKHISDITDKDVCDMELLWNVLVEKKEIDTAQQLIESYLQDNQDCFEGWYQLARIRSMRNDREKAKGCLLRALEAGFADLDLLDKDPGLKGIYETIAN